MLTVWCARVGTQVLLLRVGLATLILSLYTYQAPNVRSLSPIDEIDEASAWYRVLLLPTLRKYPIQKRGKRW